MTQDDRLLAIRPGGDDIDRHFRQHLQALQVFAGIHRQSRVVGDTDGRLPPARELLVYRLEARVALDAERWLRDDLTVDTITDRYPDRIETVEHIELGDAQARDARMHDGPL